MPIWKISDRPCPENQGAISEETKARYDELERLRVSSLAEGEANREARKARQAENIALKSFV